jgi:MraZ protein
MEASDFLFLGTYTGMVDDKGRLNIPADFRHSLEECGENELIFTPGIGEFIHAFPRRVYLSYWKSVDPSNTLFTREESLDADIAIHGASQRKSIDTQGRVTLPPLLFERSGISRDVVFIGRRNHFIIWDKASYETYIKEKGITPGEAWKRHREMQP